MQRELVRSCIHSTLLCKYSGMRMPGLPPELLRPLLCVRSKKKKKKCCHGNSNPVSCGRKAAVARN